MPLVPPGLLPPNDRKELFSRAYVQAIASAAGYSLDLITSVDRDSVDVRISSGATYCTFASPCVEVQLKCTSTDVIRDNHIAYPLPIKNYNDLRKKSMSPRLLIVVVVPEDLTTWLDQDESQMVLRNCAYYISLHGRRSVNNTENITVHIPRANVLNVAAMHYIFDRAGSGARI